MTLAITPYNVLAFEPEAVKPMLRIAAAVLAEVEKRANARFTQGLLPELAKLGLVPPGMTVEEFAALSRQMPPAIAPKITLPEEERFIVNLKPYEELGGVPARLEAFAQAYARMAPAGVTVAFFNTACSGGTADYEALAAALDGYPALRSATWIVTTSLRESMPKSFMERIARQGGGKMSGPAAKQLAVSLGSPCLVAIGDSIVIRTATEAAAVIYDRLKYVRKMEGIVPQAKP
jgi:hypothetical protein